MDSIKYCPNCNSGVTKLVEKYVRTSPTVYGGRNSKGELTDSYWSCQTCGIRFDEL